MYHARFPARFRLVRPPMNIRVEVDDYLIAALRERTAIRAGSELARDGLTLLHWATHEVGEGNRVVSITPDGEIRVPVMEVLQRAAAGQPKDST